MKPATVVTSAPIIGSVGSWDEAGLVRDLDKKGFTPPKCGSELIANACDYFSPMVRFKEDNLFIKMIDIGIGMNYVSLEKMFRMNFSNNELRQSKGVSGYGGKHAIYLLSKNNGKPSTTILYTKMKDESYLKAIMPWNEIVSEQMYTGKITIHPMTDEEIEEFIADRKDDLHQYGTTIKWEYSDDLMKTIESQFHRRTEIVDLSTRWDIIFGIDNIDIHLVKSDGTPQITLPKYNYFGGNDNLFYDGKQIDIIDHFVDHNNVDRFILTDKTDQKLEIKQNPVTTSTKPVPVSVNPTWNHVGYYEIYNGMRKNIQIFNETSPTKLDSAACFLSPYEADFFTYAQNIDHLKTYLSQVRLYRQNQCITEFHLDGFNAGTSRGNARSMLRSFHHRTEVRYTTYSTQDNRMDIVMGIQGNKNANQKNFPKTLTKMISWLKETDVSRIDDHFDKVITNHNKHRIPEPRITAVPRISTPVLPIVAATVDTVGAVAAKPTAKPVAKPTADVTPSKKKSTASTTVTNLTNKEKLLKCIHDNELDDDLIQQILLLVQNSIHK